MQGIEDTHAFTSNRFRQLPVKIAMLRPVIMRGTGFEPANTYVTRPSTLRPSKLCFIHQFA